MLQGILKKLIFILRSYELFYSSCCYAALEIHLIRDVTTH